MRTKWEILKEQQTNAKANLERIENEMFGLEQTPCKLNCAGCGEYLETEADFADHFEIPDEQYLNLGRCPRNWLKEVNTTNTTNTTQNVNVWGTDKQLIGEGFCAECEHASPGHYTNCPLHRNNNSRTVKRIDPIGCGCTDCIVGYSIPLDIASDHQIKAMVRGHLIDATSQTEFDFDAYMKDR